MIRVLFIGPDAESWSHEMREAAPSMEIEAVRLPAAAVRSFDRTPPDAIIYCWRHSARGLREVADAIQGRPLGHLIPAVVVGEQLPDAAANFEEDVGVDELLTTVAGLIDVTVDELKRDVETPHEPLPVASAAARPSTGAVDSTAIQEKLRQVRHESYFVVLEVSVDATDQDLREAFDVLQRRFSSQNLTTELTVRFAAELDEIRDGLEDAFAVLTDERLRPLFAR